MQPVLIATAGTAAAAAVAVQEVAVAAGLLRFAESYDAPGALEPASKRLKGLLVRKRRQRVGNARRAVGLQRESTICSNVRRVFQAEGEVERRGRG